MPVDSASSLKDFVNQITTEVLNQDLLKKTSDAICSLIGSSFKIAEDGLKAVQNITKPPAP